MMQPLSLNPPKKKIWINSLQATFRKATSKVKVAVLGRGTGKTTLMGIKSRDRMSAMPGALFFLSSSTYNQILTKSLPPMIDFWRSVGLEEYDWSEKRGHYVIGKRPPKHFLKPYKAPQKYEYAITFYNGYTIELISMDRPDKSRGGNYDGGDIDEAALVKKDALMKAMMPSVRGNKDKFNSVLHGEICLYTSMPWLADGQYILDFEEKAKQEPHMFFYMEGTAECNLPVLGPTWIEDQRSMLDPHIFRLEVMNERLIKAETSFYHRFNDERHVYTPAYSYKDNPTGRGIMTDGTGDYNADQVLDLAIDFGGWFTCCLVFQAYIQRAQSTERMINSFMVKEGKGIEDLVDLFCDDYIGHRMKYVRLYGEPRGNDKSGHGVTLYERAYQAFMARGWQVELCVHQSQAHGHDVRYTYMNQVLSEEFNHPRLRINRDTCKNVIIAIQMTGTTHDLKKDKSNERNRAFAQEHAPHFTDALDYYYMQKHYSSSQAMGMEVW